MKRLYFILSIVFIILTFIGAMYVIFGGDNISAGYAVIPMLWAIVFIYLFI